VVDAYPRRAAQRYQRMTKESVQLVRTWGETDLAAVVTLRLRALPSPYRALSQRVRQGAH
jgi:hypothetical protein